MQAKLTRGEETVAFTTTQRANVVRVTVPASVANSLEKFQQVQKEVFGRLGHSMCLSGWDIRWDMETLFTVDEKLNVKTSGFFA